MPDTDSQQDGFSREQSCEDEPRILAPEPKLGVLCRRLEELGHLTLAGHLRGCFRHEWVEPDFVLTFDTEMSGQVAILEKEDKKEQLRNLITELFGAGINLVFKIQEDPQRLKLEEKERTMIEIVERHPIVMLTKDIFNGKILSIKKEGDL